MEPSTSYKVEYKTSEGLWHSGSLIDLRKHSAGEGLEVLVSKEDQLWVPLKELRWANN